MYTIYGKDSCPYCLKAKEFLKNRKELFTYVDLDDPDDHYSNQFLISEGATTIPQIYYDDWCIGGYSDLFALPNSHFTSNLPPVEVVELVKGIKYVLKRDGTTEPFQAKKINDMVEWAVKADSSVQWSEVVMLAMDKLSGDTYKVSDIQKALIDACLDKETESHNKVAGRLLLGSIRKTSKADPDFIKFYKFMVEGKYWRKMKWDQLQLQAFASHIDHDKDLGYGYPSFRQFRDKYSIKDHDGNLLELPQYMYMGIAMARFEKSGNWLDVIHYYKLVSDHKINLPSPQLSTTRTPSNAGVSCVLITGGDSLHGIEAAKHIAFLSTAASAGIGIEMDVRSPGDSVRNGYAKAGGKMPHYRTISATVKEVKQSNRGGSATTSFTCLDPEVMDLLKLKLPRTSEERKIDKLDYSLIVNQSFLRRAAKRQDWALVSRADFPELYSAFYKEDCIEFDKIMDTILAMQCRKQVIGAYDVLDRFLESRQEIGRYYETNITHANKHTPFDTNITPIRISNLCQEILLPTKAYNHITELYKNHYDYNDGMTALCFISAIDVYKIKSDEEYEQACYYALKSLDDLIDDMVYPTPQIEFVAKAWRSVGVGMTNVAQLIASAGKSYKDHAYIHWLAERHYYFLLKASIQLAKERGKFDWYDYTRWGNGWTPLETYNKNVDSLYSECKFDWENLKSEVAQHGVRFSVLCAHMPCESSSVMTNGTNSLYPIRNDLVYKDSKGGDIQFFAPNYTKYDYEEVWDLSFKHIADFYAICQKWCDQAISADTFVDFSKYPNKQVPKSERTKNYLYWNKMGIKTMYYQNPKTGRGEKGSEPDCAECSF
jgi:ribonucleoside-diphosphate reductase alpha chain